MTGLPLYKILDWDDHYENNRTRGLKTMAWLALPTTYWSNGYTELISHPAGIAHFACWITALQVAAHCSPRGTLIQKSGIPHTPASISRLTRIEANLYAEAFKALTTLGWLECEPSAAQVPDECAIAADAVPYVCARDAPTLQDITLQNRTSQGDARGTGGAVAAAPGVLQILESSEEPKKVPRGTAPSVKDRWNALADKHPALSRMTKEPHPSILRKHLTRLREEPGLWSILEAKLATFDPGCFGDKWPTFSQVCQVKTWTNLTDGVYDRAVTPEEVELKKTETARKTHMAADMRELHRDRQTSKESQIAEIARAKAQLGFASAPVSPVAPTPEVAVRGQPGPFNAKLSDPQAPATADEPVPELNHRQRAENAAVEARGRRLLEKGMFSMPSEEDIEAKRRRAREAFGR